MKKFNKKQTNKTIASTIINGTSIFSFIIIITLSFFSLFFQYKATVRIVKEFLETETITAADKVSWVVKSYKNIAESIGTIPELSMEDVPLNFKLLLLQDKAYEFGLRFCNIIKPDGYVYTDDTYRGDREYFKQALKGNVVISDPMISRTDGILSLNIAAPIWRGGIYNSTIDAVLFCSLQTETFNEIIEDLKVSENSDAYIINKEGTVVAAVDDNLVLNRNNNILNAKTDPSYKNIAEMEKKILAGEHKVRIIREGLTPHCYMSAPIAGTPDWTVILETPLNDYLRTFYVALFFMMTLAVLAILLSIKQTLHISEKISIPVEKMAERLKQAAVGDFSSEVKFDESLSEIKVIADATQVLLNRMDVVFNKTESYKSYTHLNEILEFKKLAEVMKVLDEKMNVSISILDNHAHVLLGSEDFSPTCIFMEPIMVNDQKFGVCKIGSNKDCVMGVDELVGLAKCFALSIGKMAEFSLQRAGDFESWRQNLTFNTQKLVSKMEMASKALADWILTLEHINDGTEKVDLKTFLPTFISKNIEMISVINESTEYARFSNFDTGIIETDYKVEDLVAEIRSQIEAESNGQNQYSFTMKPGLPPSLFGASNSISRVITRIATVLAARNQNSNIELSFSANTTTFGASLNIEICIMNHEMPDNEVGRLKILMRQSSLKIDKLKPTEQKILGALRMAHEINGDLKAISAENMLTILISIPQLIASASEEKK